MWILTFCTHNIHPIRYFNRIVLGIEYKLVLCMHKLNYINIKLLSYSFYFYLVCVENLRLIPIPPLNYTKEIPKQTKEIPKQTLECACIGLAEGS